ncbi:hypothetical protein MKEN_00910400 [Mycena kentingensis (nom. inval.)]|nr:hypothetical protein MKEN_00910400 [Mycena kentingensis (nom. inval.)]
MPTVQIAQFPISEAFTKTPEVFKAPLDVIKTAEGHISSFYGLQVEDKAYGYFISVWESYEHHMKLVAEPSYKSLIEVLRPATADTSKFARHHIEPTKDPLQALGAPATERVIFTLKEGAEPEQLGLLLEELGAGLDAAAGAHPPCVWGQSREDKTKFLLLVGWDTVEAHWEAVKEGTALHATVLKIAAISELVIGHAPLKQG